MWVVGVAEAGLEEGSPFARASCIVAPTGETVAMCSTTRDELATASCDLDRCAEIRDNVFNFAQHRQPDTYKLISETKPGPETVKV